MSIERPNPRQRRGQRPRISDSRESQFEPHRLLARDLRENRTQLCTSASFQTLCESLASLAPPLRPGCRPTWQEIRKAHTVQSSPAGTRTRLTVRLQLTVAPARLTDFDSSLCRAYRFALVFGILRHPPCISPFLIAFPPQQACRVSVGFRTNRWTLGCDVYGQNCPMPGLECCFFVTNL